LTSDRFENSNKAYSFDGTNDYINVQNNASLQIVNAITLSAWVRPDTIFSVPQTFGGRIIDKCTVGGTDGYLLDLGANVNGISGGQEKRARFIGVNNNAFSTEFYTASYIWYYISLTFDGTSAKFYVNGILDTINSLPGALQINNLPLRFGGHNQQNNSWFFGKIDDIGIWNRALTQQEITDLYNGNICYQTITVTDTLLINMGTTGFNPVTYNNTIKIFPNPTNDHITINYGNFTSLNGYQLKIINSLGQQVFQTNVVQQSDYLNLTTWGGNGLYFVQIIDQQGNIIDIRKIVLQ
jgi:hypothetical protein